MLDALWQIPIWREGRVLVEGLALRRGRSILERTRPPDHGRPVLLIPGYLAGDGTLGPLANRLRQVGYVPHHALIAANVDCATRTTERLTERLRSIAEAHGERPVIVGHSLGGVLGRLLAVRRPDLVGGVVCLGSPLLDLQAVHPLVWAHVRLVSLAGNLGLPGVLSGGCLSGACCAESRELLRAPFPGGVEFVSVYSRCDGVVHWRSCLDPAAEHVEVDSTHLGMAVNLAVHQVVADRLSLVGDIQARPSLRAAA